MKPTNSTIDRLLTEMYHTLGFTDVQIQQAKGDIEALIKTRVVEALVTDLSDDVVQTIRQKSKTVTLSEFQDDLVRVLMAVYSKEEVVSKVRAVTDTVVGEYLDFMLTKSNTTER